MMVILSPGFILTRIKEIIHAPITITISSGVNKMIEET